MTIEEAIICLKGIKIYGRDTFNEQSDWQGCLDIAIKSLEAWEKVKEELKEYGSLWVSYTIKEHTDKAIEDIVEDVLKQAKQQFVEIIDKHLAKLEGVNG